MRKEVLIAIVVGFTLGLVITFGIWTANNAMKKIPPVTTPTPGQEEQELVSPAPTTSEFTFTISSPENNSLVSEEKIPLTGKFAPESTIVILAQGEEKITQTDSNGNFSSEVTLQGGVNRIEIFAFDKNGNEESQTINIVYSTAEI